MEDHDDDQTLRERGFVPSRGGPLPPPTLQSRLRPDARSFYLS